MESSADLCCALLVFPLSFYQSTYLGWLANYHCGTMFTPSSNASFVGVTLTVKQQRRTPFFPEKQGHVMSVSAKFSVA